jgi:alpha-mannosidase
VLVKTSFPFNINANVATYEIPCGAIQRSTRPQTEAERAKWEVSALRWADLSDAPTNDSYGISILSDCKHGYDARPNQLRLTLLRGSKWPDPNSDLGQHRFSYAVYPHDRDWRTAQTVRRGYEVNQPLRVLNIAPPPRPTTPTLPVVGDFLSLPSNFLLSAFKPSEDNPNQWLLRGYECHGMSGSLNWQGGLGATLKQVLNPNATRLNLLEQPVPDAVGTLNPWQIATYRFNRI